MKYQFRALCTGAPIVLDNCGAGYEADTDDDAWHLVMWAINLKDLDRTRYAIEPLGAVGTARAEVST
jgi:hypothetical protein